MLALRRWRLRSSHEAAVGHELPKWRGPDDGARSPDAHLRIPDLDAHCHNFVADEEKDLEQRSARKNILRLLDSDGRCTLLDRIHPHQSALISWHVQRADREPGFHPSRNRSGATDQASPTKSQRPSVSRDRQTDYCSCL